MIKNIGVFLIYLISSTTYGLPTDSLIVEEKQDVFLIKNINATVQLQKKGWHLSLMSSENKIRYSEVQAHQFFIHEKWESITDIDQLHQISAFEIDLDVYLSNGQKANFSIKRAGSSGFWMTVEPEQATALRGKNTLNPVEEIYGFGETWNGRVAQRGETIEIWDQVGTPDECSYMPYYVSTNNYTFFLNYGGRVKFDIGQSNSGELFYEAPTGRLEYLLVSGENVASSVSNYLKITGLPAKPPRWAFEPWFWLMGDPDYPGAGISTLKDYHFTEMIHSLGSMDIPVGVTWFEPPWQTARTTFVPNPGFTKDFRTEIDEIEALGVKVLGWTVPYTTYGASNFTEAAKKGFLVKNPDRSIDSEESKVSSSGEILGRYYNYIDFFNPKAKEWWKGQIASSLKYGLKGFKLDAGQNLQEDALIYGGREGKDYHNSYALEYNRVFYEALREEYDDDFLMIPRATWVGSTSYTNFKWPGDLSGTFGNNGLPSTLYSSLSLALSGFPFVSSDIGGFEPHKRAPENVWIRWAQFGAMIPGMQTMQMPWWFSEKAQKHFRYLTWLHKDLIPYWHSLAYESQSSGAPIIRPLVWEYQDDPNTWRTDDQFTVGQYLFVAPIINTEPERDIYLPEGRWIDFWDENVITEGGMKFRWAKEKNEEGLWKFPLYIKEGAIIPMEIVNKVSGFGSLESKDYITMAIWPKKGTSEFVLHDRENPVEFMVSSPSDESLEVAWSESAQDYLLRIKLTEKIPNRLLFNKSKKPIKQYNNMERFRGEKDDGWYFDNKISVLWIRKKQSNGKSVVTVGF